jgi:hypothetical protein
MGDNNGMASMLLKRISRFLVNKKLLRCVARHLPTPQTPGNLVPARSCPHIVNIRVRAPLEGRAGRK